MVRLRWLAVLALTTAAACDAGCSGTQSCGESRPGLFSRLMNRQRGVPCELTEIPVEGCPPGSFGPALPDAGVPAFPTGSGGGIPSGGAPIIYPGAGGAVPPGANIPPPGLLPAPMPVGPATPVPAEPSSIKGIKAVNR